MCGRIVTPLKLGERTQYFHCVCLLFTPTSLSPYHGCVYYLRLHLSCVFGTEQPARTKVSAHQRKTLPQGVASGRSDKRQHSRVKDERSTEPVDTLSPCSPHACFRCCGTYQMNYMLQCARLRAYVCYENCTRICCNLHGHGGAGTCCELFVFFLRFRN